MLRLLTLLPLAMLLSAPLQAASERAEQLAQRLLIADTHIDVPYRLHSSWADVTRSAPDREFDLPRALAGGLNVPFMSIYVPASHGESDSGWQVAHQQIDNMEALVGRMPERFAIAYSVDDVLAHQREGKISLALGLENGAPIAGDLQRLKVFHERGIRYITLAHSLSNHIADSSYDDNRQWDGLSPFGRRLVGEMNRLGIMVDVSHISDAAFRDVIEVSAVPVLATHSSARHFTPGFERNMDDAMIEQLGANGGVIQINFGSMFLTEAANAWRVAQAEALAAFMEQAGDAGTSEALATFRAQYLQQHPFPFATLEDVLDHIDHVVALTGVDHVGIGSDYDGVGDTLPEGLKDVAAFPTLIDGLLDRGYTEEEIARILGGNTLRVWRAAEAYARQH